MASAAEQLAANLNFGTFAKAEELQQRIWFTLGALARLPARHLHPGARHRSRRACADLRAGQSNGILGMFNMFSGGAVQRMAIFALDIMPYISASIIVQLLASVSPRWRS